MDGKADPLWFLGTLTRVKLDGEDTSGRLGAFEVTLPRGASPPLHTHPQDETLYILDGDVTAWIVPPEEATAAADGSDPPAWVADCAQALRPGDMVYAAGGVPHSFRVESDTARILTLSTPAGIEAWVRELAEPAQWPWLQPPHDGPRVAPERMEEVGRRYGFTVVAPPPPPASR